MTKRLFEVSYTYGKGDGGEVGYRNILEDTKETRKEILEKETGMFSEILSDEDDFINGKIDYVDILLDGGDWDDPTGAAIVIYDKDELITREKGRHARELAEIERLFKEGD